MDCLMLIDGNTGTVFKTGLFSYVKITRFKKLNYF